MNKIGIIYWSGTGNTEAMANGMFEALQNDGKDVTLYQVNDFNAADAKDFDGFLLGCPAMGAEVLEECEFQPKYDELKDYLKDKKVALFGSYGWGSGEWMDSWEVDVKNAGAILFEKGLIINETPDDEAINSCKEFALSFVK